MSFLLSVEFFKSLKINCKMFVQKLDEDDFGESEKINKRKMFILEGVVSLVSVFKTFNQKREISIY